MQPTSLSTIPKLDSALVSRQTSPASPMSTLMSSFERDGCEAVETSCPKGVNKITVWSPSCVRIVERIVCKLERTSIIGMRCPNVRTGT